MALATATADDERRVAPSGAIFYRARFCVPTVTEAAKPRMPHRQATGSLTDYHGNDLAVIVHGRAEVLGPESTEIDALVTIQRESTGTGARDWGNGVYLRLFADRLFTFARSEEILQQHIEPHEAE